MTPAPAAAQTPVAAAAAAVATPAHAPGGTALGLPHASPSVRKFARELGVPVVSDEQFMDNVGSVALGTGIDDFVQSVDQGQQFALF